MFNVKTVLKTILLLLLFLFVLSGTAHGGNLVQNGDFELNFNADGTGDSIPRYWSKREGRDPPENSTIASSTLNGIAVAGSKSLRCTRTGGGYSGDWTAVWQALAIDTSTYVDLQLSVDARVTYHDLEAGGWVAEAFEWPVFVEVTYRLASNPSQTQIWRHGWYVDPPGDSWGGPVNDPGTGLITYFNDTLVPVNTWTTTTFDLLAELPDLGVITRIAVGGSGWSYDGRVDNVNISGTAGWKARYPNYSPSGMPDFDQKQDLWAHGIVCGPNGVAETTADPLSDDVQLTSTSTTCVAGSSQGVVGKGADQILQTVPQGDDTPHYDWCVPTAVANCLWWFDSKYADTSGTPDDGSDAYNMVTAYPIPPDDHSATNVDDPNTPVGGIPYDPTSAFGELIEDLAWRMDTDGQLTQNPSHAAGTTAVDAQRAVQQYIKERGLEDEYIVQLIEAPTFSWIEEEILRSQDLILFLAFTQYCQDQWKYIGGHAVTVAGVAAEGSNADICMSDPFFDTAEAGGAGYVRPGGTPHGHTGPPETLHNDAQYASHDCYPTGSSPGSPWSDLTLPSYARTVADEQTQCGDIENFYWQNLLDPNDPAYWPESCEPSCPIVTRVAFALEISPFYWKEGDWIDYAPNGVPDFDQKQSTFKCPSTQDWSHCGPTAVANSFWWFDSKFEPSPVAPTTVNDNYALVQSSVPVVDDHATGNVVPLIQSLAGYMNTDANLFPLNQCGTYAFEMVQGIKDWLKDNSLDTAFYVKEKVRPAMWDIAPEVKKSQDVILLLGFWEDQNGTWIRTGGHYVTVVGIDEEANLLAISDPFRDGAEAGTSGGRVLGSLPHGHPPLPPDGTHNDAQNVSHDLYSLIPHPVSDPVTNWGGDWALEGYGDGLDVENFACQNLGTSEEECGGAYQGGQIFTVIEWFVEVSPCSTGGNVDEDGDGLTICENDCNDANADVYPGAPEICDGVNNDCDAPDWPDVPLDELDEDQDGVMVCEDDCNDNDASVYPEAPELCDGISNDCYDLDWPIPHPDDYDGDGDGVPQTCGNDCDDGNPAIYPGAPEICDGLNNDCNHGSWPTPVTETDDDGDTLAECEGDCDDSRDYVHPGAPQLCDGFNNDCDDLSWPVVPPDEVDNDADLYAECEDDCDDSNADVYPGAPQICDTLNNDCYHFDWPNPLPLDTDTDEDGFSEICGEDCDDGHPLVYPGAPQLCDGVNNDCDDLDWPTVPAGELDGDGDGLPACAGDCLDADPDIWGLPGEAGELLLDHSGGLGGTTTLTWAPPVSYGGNLPPWHDTVGSYEAGDFLTDMLCVETDSMDDVSLDTWTVPPDSIRYYLIRPENACGEGPAGQNFYGGLRPAQSCFAMNLTSSFYGHLISLPREVYPPITSAQDLMDQLAWNGLSPISVGKWNIAAADYETWFGGPGSCESCGGACFCLDPAEGLGYLVKLGTSGPFFLQGIDSTSPVNLYAAGSNGSATGDNLISLPFSSPLQTADDLLNDVGASAVSTVFRHIPSTGTFEFWTGFAGTNFVLVPGEGYNVRVILDTIYTPCSIAAGPCP